MNELGKSLLESSLGDSWAGIALLFLVFSYFLAGAIGSGFALRKAIFPRSSLLHELSDALLFASLLLFCLAFLLAAEHGLHWFPRSVFWLAFLPGIFALRSFLPLAISAFWQNRRFALLVFLFVFFVRALTAAIPSQHGDPLLYHLLGPRLWMEAGGFLMHPNLPNALLASSWECLYIWPQLFWFSSQPLFGLVEAQIFSQWLHLFLAWGGCALLVMRIFRGAVRDAWLPLAGLAAIFVAGVQWTAPLAKNDAGIAFWVLGALIYFLEGMQGRNFRKVLLAGIFAGLAVCGKITALLSLAPLLAILFVILQPWKSPLFFLRAAGIWLLGCAAGAAPIYVRNYILSENPFFPLFPATFPSPWVSRSWGAHFSQVSPSSPPHSIPHLLGRLPELFRESPWILGAFLLLAAAAVVPKKMVDLESRIKFGIIIGSFLAYVLFVLTLSKEIELRYLGASLMILAAGGTCFFLRMAELLPSRKAQNSAVALLFLAIFATSKLPLHVLRKIWASPLGVAALNTHSAGQAKTWLRAHAAGGFVVVAGDNETYYLTPLGVAVLTERPDLDAANSEKELSSFLQKLCSLTHARFLLDARPEIGIEARFGAGPLISAKVFSAQGANIYDLRILESAAGAPKVKSCH